ncbi:hypothetical protein [Rhodoferax sp.]|uniref:hypothetical protein n=1 Tax=Rhodoferax sp. TaxID=50421 RepID=UPI00261E328A|nr:hypothetical protein [Rhodoferax sp.]MDD2924747.1 hypothetical protein [Rhodoferax sp.]
MLLDLHAQPILPPDRQVLSELDWGEVAKLWDNNQLGQLHDWLNERWARLIRNSPLGTKDPEAELLQALAFATLALFFTQNQNQEGALLMLDDAMMALGKYRPSYMGVRIESIYGTLEDLRPMLVGLASDADCPMYPFVYPRFEYSRAAP